MISWTEKLNASTPHEIKPAPIDFAGMRAGELMLVPSARMIDDFIRAIPAGTSVDYRAMRSQLAAEYETETCCPVYTGFHLRTVAEAAHEALEAGATLEEVTPIWRVLDETTPTTKKLSYDTAFIFERRKLEGLS